MQGLNSAQIHWLPDPFLLSRFRTRSYRRGSGFILFRRYESSAKNAEHPMRGRGPRKTLSVAVSGVAPVRPRGPSTMFELGFAQVSGGTALSNSNPRGSKSSRDSFFEEASGENHIFEIPLQKFKILNAKRCGDFETTVSLDTSSKKRFRPISKLSGPFSKWRSRPGLPQN